MKMTVPLFIFCSILLIFGYMIQKKIASYFIIIIYDLIPENLLPQKLNELRKKGVEISATLTLISIGVSPITNTLKLELPKIDYNQTIWVFTLYWIFFVAIGSYILIPICYLFDFKQQNK